MKNSNPALADKKHFFFLKNTVFSAFSSAVKLAWPNGLNKAYERGK